VALFLISCGAVQCTVRFTVLLSLCYLPTWNLWDDHNLVYITTKQKRYQENSLLHFHKQLEQFLCELNLYIVKYQRGRMFHYVYSSATLHPD